MYEMCVYGIELYFLECLACYFSEKVREEWGVGKVSFEESVFLQPRMPGLRHSRQELIRHGGSNRQQCTALELL